MVFSMFSNGAFASAKSNHSLAEQAIEIILENNNFSEKQQQVFINSYKTTFSKLGKQEQQALVNDVKKFYSSPDFKEKIKQQRTNIVNSMNIAATASSSDYYISITYIGSALPNQLGYLLIADAAGVDRIGDVIGSTATAAAVGSGVLALAGFPITAGIVGVLGSVIGAGYYAMKVQLWFSDYASIYF